MSKSTSPEINPEKVGQVNDRRTLVYNALLLVETAASNYAFPNSSINNTTATTGVAYTAGEQVVGKAISSNDTMPVEAATQNVSPVDSTQPNLAQIRTMVDEAF